jgi:uncharacterized protein YhfF
LTELPPFELGHPRTELRQRLVAAVLSDEKTATAGLWSEYEAERQSLDEPGARYALHWRLAHEDFFQQPLEPDTRIVAVRFRVVERL